MSIKTILLVTHTKFWHENRGGIVRTANLYRFLISQDFSVPIFFVGEFNDTDRVIIQSNFKNPKIFTLQDGGPRKNEKPAQKKRLRDIQKLISRKILTYHQTDWLLRYVEPKLQDFKSGEYVAYFRQICLDIQPDMIFVSSIRMAYLVQEIRDVLPDHTCTVIDNMDVMHQRCQMFHQFGERHWVNITEEEETQTLDLFDVVIAIQNKDAAMFRKMLPNKQVITVYHATKIQAHPNNLEFPVRVTYVGTNSPHNRDAIGNFLKTIWPVLHARFKNQISLNIVGSVCDFLGLSSLPEGVHLHGVVKDLETIYEDSDIIINPVNFGGGLKIKNVEALCNGKSLVTTTLGAEGLEHGIGEAFFVCDVPDAFVKTLSRLIIDPSFRQSLSLKALAFARKNFSEEFAYLELSQLLNKVIQK